MRQFREGHARPTWWDAAISLLRTATQPIRSGRSSTRRWRGPRRATRDSLVAAPGSIIESSGHVRARSLARSALPPRPYSILLLDSLFLVRLLLPADCVRGKIPHGIVATADSKSCVFRTSLQIAVAVDYGRLNVPVQRSGRKNLGMLSVVR